MSLSTEVESFKTADGAQLRLTRRSAGRQRAVLVVPGIFMDRQSVEHRLLAERLATVVDVFTLDVRGHGDSGGAFSFGLQEPEDVAQVAAWLRTRYPRLGGLGFSFGGYHTAVAAARHRPFDAVALVAAPRRLFILDHNFLTRGLLRSLAWSLGRERRPTRLWPTPFGRRAVPGQLVDGIAPTPLLILHGTDDWLIPVAHARELYARAREPKTLQLLEGQLHAEAILARDPEALLVPLLRFFEDTL